MFAKWYSGSGSHGDKSKSGGGEGRGVGEEGKSGGGGGAVTLGNTLWLQLPMALDCSLLLPCISLVHIVFMEQGVSS